jgi:hypothetical protein
MEPNASPATAATAVDQGSVMSQHARVDDRQELHNASVDEEVAETGACAHVHLPTGGTCTLEQHHEGSCDFVPRDEIEESLTLRHPLDDR